MRIMILSDSPLIPTGYSNQSKLLARFLRKKGHEVHYLASSHLGTTLDFVRLPDGTEFDYKIYGEMRHTYFMETIEERLKKIKPDILFILLDTFMLFPHLLNKDLSPAKSVFWFPSDGGKMPINCEHILKKVDVAVAMSKFGQKQVKDYYGIETKYIPHGTEVNKFFRLKDNERMMLRQKWGLNDKFVIGVVARNQPRKMLDRTLKAMFLIKDKIPNAVLFLHMDPLDPAAAFNILNMIKSYNLENRVIFSGMKAHEGFDWSRMNEVYNIMDCFFLSTSGEGFGIPIIEAMSAEIPVIATDYTTTQELVKDNQAGFGVNLAGVINYLIDKNIPIDLFDWSKNMKEYDEEIIAGTLTGSWEVERGLMDINDATNKIEWLYKHPDKAKEMGKNGRKAVEENYDFDKIIGPAFESLFLGENK